MASFAQAAPRLRHRLLRVKARTGFMSLAMTAPSEQVDAAVAQGAKALVGGRRNDSLPGLFYEPTVLSGLRQDDEQVQTEIFGPVMTVQKFTDEAEALRLNPATSDSDLLDMKNVLEALNNP